MHAVLACVILLPQSCESALFIPSGPNGIARIVTSPQSRFNNKLGEWEHIAGSNIGLPDKSIFRMVTSSEAVPTPRSSSNVLYVPGKLILDERAHRAFVVESSGSLAMLRRKLEILTRHPVEYVPDNGFLITGNMAIMKACLEIPSVLRAAEWHPSLKINHMLHWNQTVRDSIARRGRRLLIQFHLHGDHATNLRIMQRWSSHWQQHHPGVVQFRASHAHRTEAGLTVLVARVKSDEAVSIAQWIAEHPRVRHVSPRGPRTTQNSEASRIIQGISVKPSASETLNAGIAWRNGLFGATQVIAMSDEGLDLHNCFFADANRTAAADLPICRQCTYNVVSGSGRAENCSFHGDTVCTNPRASQHRKLVSLWSFADSKDSYENHGTHTAGSLAGDPTHPRSGAAVEDLLAFRGVAPSARLAFVDIGKKGRSQLLVPKRLTDLFEFGHRHGAAVQSHSWGGTLVNRYTLDGSAAIDEYMWRRRSALLVFPAGNGGRKGAGTLTPEANSKNALTVGASWTSRTHATVLAPNVSALNGWRALQSDFCRAATYYKHYKYNGDRHTLLVWLRRLGGFSNQYEWNDLPYCHKLTHEGPDYCCRGDGTHAHAGFATVQKNILKRFCCSSDFAGPYGGVTEDALASWSSQGPAEDGRVKPDVVAPGAQIVSARGQNTGNRNSPNARFEQAHCGFNNSLTPKSGTSMATPLVAGAAALVREYFETGHYCTGHIAMTVEDPESADCGFSPSGALLKACIIHSAKALTRVYHEAPQHTQSMAHGEGTRRQGSGRIDLSRVLSFPGDTNASHGLYLAVWEANITASDCRHVYRVNVTALGSPVPPNSTAPPLRATLVWTDPPASSATGKQLVHNLDLTVRAIGGIGGNGPSFLGNAHLHPDGAAAAQADSVNNVEAVVIKSATAGIYEVEVRVQTLVFPQQEYALVVTAACDSDAAPGVTCAQRWNISSISNPSSCVESLAPLHHVPRNCSELLFGQYHKKSEVDDIYVRTNATNGGVPAFVGNQTGLWLQYSRANSTWHVCRVDAYAAAGAHGACPSSQLVAIGERITILANKTVPSDPIGWNFLLGDSAGADMSSGAAVTQCVSHIGVDETPTNNVSDCTCSNSCKFSRDGECDDGGPGSHHRVCPLGTDCADCGPSTRTSVASNASCADIGTGNGPASCACLDTCDWARDGECDDGGPGAMYSGCGLGTDCYDCGPSNRSKLSSGGTCADPGRTRGPTPYPTHLPTRGPTAAPTQTANATLAEADTGASSARDNRYIVVTSVLASSAVIGVGIVLFCRYRRREKRRAQDVIDDEIYLYDHGIVPGDEDGDDGTLRDWTKGDADIVGFGTSSGRSTSNSRYRGTLLDDKRFGEESPPSVVGPNGLVKVQDLVAVAGEGAIPEPRDFNLGALVGAGGYAAVRDASDEDEARSSEELDDSQSTGLGAPSPREAGQAALPSPEIRLMRFAAKTRRFVRRQPSEDSPFISKHGSVWPGEIVSVMASRGGFSRIVCSIGTGWVRSRHLGSVDPNLGAISEAKEPTSDPEGSGHRVGNDARQDAVQPDSRAIAALTSRTSSVGTGDSNEPTLGAIITL